MVSTNITTADTLSTKATKALDTMRARIVKAARTRPRMRRAVQVAEAATEAATANTHAAEAWDALATYAARHAADARHGAELAQRTRRRWAR